MTPQRPLTSVIVLLGSLAISAITDNMTWFGIAYPLAAVVAFIPYRGKGMR